MTNLITFAPACPKPRTDGWTADRQDRFIELLAGGATVEEASGQVGMSEQSAYRLRLRADAAGFRRAWSDAIDASVPVMVNALVARAIHGTKNPMCYKGHVVDYRTTHSDSLLKMLLQRRAPLEWAPLNTLVGVDLASIENAETRLQRSRAELVDAGDDVAEAKAALLLVDATGESDAAEDAPAPTVANLTNFCPDSAPRLNAREAIVAALTPPRGVDAAAPAPEPIPAERNDQRAATIRLVIDRADEEAARIEAHRVEYADLTAARERDAHKWREEAVDVDEDGDEDEAAPWIDDGGEPMAARYRDLKRRIHAYAAEVLSPPPAVIPAKAGTHLRLVKEMGDEVIEGGPPLILPGTGRGTMPLHGGGEVRPGSPLADLSTTAARPGSPLAGPPLHREDAVPLPEGGED